VNLSESSRKQKKLSPSLGTKFLSFKWARRGNIERDMQGREG